MAEKLYFGLDSGDVYVSELVGETRLLMSVDESSRSVLAYRLLFDALGDPSAARKLRLRFQHHPVMEALVPGKTWQKTHADILDIVNELRANDALIEQQRRLIDAERPPAEHDGGRGVAGDRITWETDLRGNRTRERGE